VVASTPFKDSLTKLFGESEMGDEDQKDCVHILADYATDIISKDPLESVQILANAGFGTEAGVILSCLASSGPKIHLLPYGYTAVAVYKFNMKNSDIDKRDITDTILIVFGVDITKPPSERTPFGFCYKFRYTSLGLGKIGHIYPCSKEELDIYFAKAQAEAQGVTQQSTPAKHTGSRQRKVKEEEPEEEEVNDNE